MVRGRRGDPDGLRTAIARYGGDLVPGIYDDWIAPHRDRLRNLHLEAIAALAARQEERREYREAIELLRQLIELDPLQESAYRSLMRVAVVSGDRSAGLRRVPRLRDGAPDRARGPAHRRDQDCVRAAPDRRPGRARPRARSTQAQPTHRFVGRDSGMDDLDEPPGCRHDRALPPSRSSRARPGSGKSRLLEELLRWTRAQGHAAVYTRSYAAEGALAYAPVAAWLRAEPISNCHRSTRRSLADRDRSIAA